MSSVVRRCATLPHHVGCSTITVPGLIFRVRNRSGRLPWAMAATSLQLSTRVGWLCGCLGTGGWTRRVCVFVTVDQVCGWVWQSPPVVVGFVSSVMRRCATLPHPVGCSTIDVPGLSFRVRNGSGSHPWAKAAASLQLSTRVGWLCGCLGTGGWTRRVCVFVAVDQVCGRSG